MTEPLIIVRHHGYVKQTPFEGDVLDRRSLADRLTAYLERLKQGGVIGIDAPWGDGKTWFGRNWAAYLNEKGFKTIYLDAFENDYIEDPFVLISAEILNVMPIGEGAKEKLLSASKSVGKALLPGAAKVTLNVLGRFLLGTSDLGKSIEDGIGDKTEGILEEVAEKFIEKRLKDYETVKQSVTRFREALTHYAEGFGKPLVFFIDELDRCKPSFAVGVIERIKHFFDVPNVVFVLLLNRVQLEQAIQGVYGVSVDASSYLGKFIHFFLTLPKKVGLERGHTDFNRAYCTHLARKYGFKQNEGVNPFIDVLSVHAFLMDMSLRDLEKAFILYAMAQPVNSLAIFVAHFIAGAHPLIL
jgi:KAP family P-loop domain